MASSTVVGQTTGMWWKTTMLTIYKATSTNPKKHIPCGACGLLLAKAKAQHKSNNNPHMTWQQGKKYLYFIYIFLHCSHHIDKVEHVAWRDNLQHLKDSLLLSSQAKRNKTLLTYHVELEITVSLGLYRLGRQWTVSCITYVSITEGEGLKEAFSNNFATSLETSTCVNTCRYSPFSEIIVGNTWYRIGLVPLNYIKLINWTHYHVWWG